MPDFSAFKVIALIAAAVSVIYGSSHQRGHFIDTIRTLVYGRYIFVFDDTILFACLEKVK